MGVEVGCSRVGKKVPGRERGYPVRRRSVEKKVCKLQPTPGHSNPRPATSQETRISPSPGHSLVSPAPGGSFHTKPGIGKKKTLIFANQAESPLAEEGSARWWTSSLLSLLLALLLENQEGKGRRTLEPWATQIWVGL